MAKPAGGLSNLLAVATFIRPRQGDGQEACLFPAERRRPRKSPSPPLVEQVWIEFPLDLEPVARQALISGLLFMARAPK